MKQYLYLTSPIPPSVNHYTAYRAIIKCGKPLGIVYKTKESVAYQADFKKAVIKAVEEQGWETDLDNPRHFYVDADFYMDKKHKDCNNLWKCLLDAVTETQRVWSDDDIVCERVNKIVYDSDNPRVELYIHYVDYIGIFDNEAQLEEFKTNNCIGCKRYKRNCTLLKNAIDGRVQEEIDGVCCTKKSQTAQG
ncbi:MAG: RusA family crossover junction endodeoxyribonuclease [Clostridia bacterium]|nr:RusA family crossover junction endodeoxyribonuclease [Clostridia bacterium]